MKTVNSVPKVSESAFNQQIIWSDSFTVTLQWKLSHLIWYALWCSRSSVGLLRHPGGVSIWRCRLTSIRIPILKIRRSRDRLIFNLGIPIPKIDGVYIETGPWSSHSDRESGLAFTELATRPAIGPSKLSKLACQVFIPPFTWEVHRNLSNRPKPTGIGDKIISCASVMNNKLLGRESRSYSFTFDERCRHITSRLW